VYTFAFYAVLASISGAFTRKGKAYTSCAGNGKIATIPELMLIFFLQGYRYMQIGQNQ
jgi:hypothetical protein